MDIKERDLRPVAGPPGKQASADIIFLHGLQGRWENHWCSTDGRIVWPRDLLPLEIPSARIFCYGYDVLALPELRMETVSRGFREFLRLYMNTRERDIPIVFIAHSLGGLLLLNALHLEQENSGSTLLPYIRGICLLGTPRFGNADQWIKFGETIATKSAESSTGSLAALSEIGTTTTANFDAWLRTSRGPSFEICCFYEVLPSGGPLVPRDAAVVPGRTARPLLRNHLNLIQHGDPGDSQFRRICDHLRPMTREIDPLLNSFNGVVAKTLRQLTVASSDGREDVLQPAAIPQELKNEIYYALTLCDEGRYQAAAEALSHLLPRASSLAGSDVGIGVFTCHKLSTTLRECGRYQDAKMLCMAILEELNTDRRIDRWASESVRRISTAVRGQGVYYHRRASLYFVGDFALTVRDQGLGSSKAIKLIIDALEGSNEALGDPRLRISLTSILAKLYKDVGYYSLSELLLRDVLLSSIREFGPENPYTLRRGSDMAALLCLRGNLSLAEEFCAHTLDKLEKSLGLYHQDSLKASQRLAYIRLFQGRYEEACARFQDVLSWQLKRLSSQHRHTLSSISGIGVCFIFQGRLEKGELFLRNARSGQIDCLGRNHPDTQWTESFIDEIERCKTKHFGDYTRTVERCESHESSKFPNGTADYGGFETLLFESLTHVLRSFLRFSDRTTSLQAPLLSSGYTFSRPSMLDDKLRIAASRGSSKEVQELLQAGANPNDVGGFYGSALHAAAYAGDTIILQMLMDFRARVDNQGGIFGNTLRAAAFGGHKEVVHRLLQRGADPNGGPAPEKSALRAAISMGHQDIVALLVEHGANKYTDDEIYGTALHEAALTGNDQMVNILLDRDTNPDIRAGIFKTAIEASAWGGSVVTTELLLRRGSSLDSRFEGQRALHLAKARGHTEVFKLIKQRLEERRPLSRAKPLNTKRDRIQSPEAISAPSDISATSSSVQEQPGRRFPQETDSDEPIELIKKGTIFRRVLVHPSHTKRLWTERKQQRAQVTRLRAR